MTTLRTILIFIIALFAFNCVQAQIKPVQPIGLNSGKLHVIIYKSKKDYSKNVAVTLNNEKSSVVSYPSIKDVKGGNNKWSATHLHKQFYLDNRAQIGEYSAFIKYTFSQYSTLKKEPNAEFILKSVIDKNPLTVLYDCGSKDAFKGSVQTSINGWIDSNLLSKHCKLLK